MAEEKTLDDLFLDTLKDIYYAEKQIVKALPKMAKAATSPDLKAGFEKHLQEPRATSTASRRSSTSSASPPAARPATPSSASSRKASRSWTSSRTPIALDAGLISAAQAVEHYEIARYGTLATWAEQLGHERRRAPAEADPRRRRSDRQEAEPSSRPPRSTSRRRSKTCADAPRSAAPGRVDSVAFQPLPGCNCRTCRFAPLLQSSRCGQLPVVRGRSCCVVCVCFS